MRDAIDQLVRKLKDTVSRRYAAKNRGALDVKKTLRRAAGYQGIPLVLFFFCCLPPFSQRLSADYA